MATTDPFPVVPSRRVRGSTLTRLGAALAACAARAEQRMGLAEPNGREPRDVAIESEPALSQPPKPSVE